MEDLDITKAKEEYLKTFQDASGKIPRQDLAVDVINYVLQQINEFSNCGNINEAQHAQMLKAAVEGLYIKIYIEHYRQGEDIIDKAPIENSSINFLKLMYTLVFRGAVYKLKEKEILAKQPITVNQGR